MHSVTSNAVAKMLQGEVLFDNGIYAQIGNVILSKSVFNYDFISVVCGYKTEGGFTPPETYSFIFTNATLAFITNNDRTMRFTGYSEYYIDFKLSFDGKTFTYYAGNNTIGIVKVFGYRKRS